MSTYGVTMSHVICTVHREHGGKNALISELFPNIQYGPA